MKLSRRGRAPRAAVAPEDLSQDLAAPLFGRLVETGSPVAMRLTREGVVVRRPEVLDALVGHGDLRGARSTATSLEIRLVGGIVLTVDADDPSPFPEWLDALGPLASEPAAPGGSGDSTSPEPTAADGAGSASSMAAVSAPVLLGRALRPALLMLEDGSCYRGHAFGAEGETFGEAVFNTGMTGYQETLTDPSYHRQVVVMTAPHVGNTGVNDVDPESRRVWVAGFVVRDPSMVASNWRARRTLDAELQAAGVVAIGGVDTRAITRRLRSGGAMRCSVSSVETDPRELHRRVLDSPGMTGADLAREVTTSAPYVVPPVGELRFRVAAVDLGMKRSTPAYLAAQGIEVHVLPATASAEEILATEADGVFFSNGPGDPAVTTYAVDAMRGVLGHRPVFGICLGNQILGRALGLGTFKLQFGHRGVNQPVQDLATGRVAITSHNHGFAVSAPADLSVPMATAYGSVSVSHLDLNDGVVEGLRCHDVPAFSVQFHPEAAPGPHDAVGLFADFAALMARSQGVRR